MKRFVVSTVQGGASPNNRFVNTLRKYCSENSAELLLIPIYYKKPQPIDDALYKDVIEGDYSLSDTLKISGLRVTPTTRYPLRGILTDDTESYIIGSPKLSLNTLPSEFREQPKYIMSPGSVTYPEYGDINNKATYFAYKDHDFGAIYIEVNKGRTIFRDLEANGNSEITDLGLRYGKNRTYKLKSAEVLKLGDYHWGTGGATNLAIRERTFKELVPELSPKRIVLEDIFDGHSISHHERHDHVKRSIKAGRNNDCLKTELDMCIEELLYIKKHSKNAQIIITAANHNEFLDRYLRSGYFVNDYKNASVSSELFKYMVDHPGGDPLEYYVKSRCKALESIRFIKRGESYRLLNTEFGQHGDKGTNGSRPSRRSAEQSSYRTVTAHTHCSFRDRGVIGVGTMTNMDLGYNKGGASSWSHSHCVMYSDGTRQLIHFYSDGYWRSDG